MVPVFYRTLVSEQINADRTSGPCDTHGDGNGVSADSFSLKTLGQVTISNSQA
jgi:hypothetical protein